MRGIDVLGVPGAIPRPFCGIMAPSTLGGADYEDIMEGRPQHKARRR